LQENVKQREAMIAKQAADAKRVEGRMRDLLDGLPAITPLEERIASADATNRQYDEWQNKTREHQEAKTKRDECNAAVTQTEKAVEIIRGNRRNLLAGLKTPLDGLTLAEDARQVVWGELPFDQASQSEQLRVSLAITAALNPELRIALVRDGSLLDDEHLAQLARWATEQQFQVWLERVGTDGASVVIEDGMVADA